MIDDNLLEVVRQSLILTLKIAAPILGAGVLIGLTISIVQSVTSIQEQTLTFVPKIFGMVLVAVLLLSWIVAKIAEFATAMFSLYGPV
ncbi:MAG: flagellar biosynthetic protein FliQ [Phycisphaeraceae bacterium]|nr:flagellar biosynthetic protein FliQ [Phycisphaeraceae bacterium]